LQACLETLPVQQHRTLVPGVVCSLAEGLAELGRFAEGLSLIDDEIVRVGDLEHSYAGPELLRVKGHLLAAASPQGLEEGKDYLRRAIACARLQSATAWELKSQNGLASLHYTEGVSAGAEGALLPVYRSLDEGTNNANPHTAARQLSDLANALSAADFQST
jgi:hypothetical protein